MGLAWYNGARVWISWTESTSYWLTEGPLGDSVKISVLRPNVTILVVDSVETVVGTVVGSVASVVVGTVGNTGEILFKKTGEIGLLNTVALLDFTNPPTEPG